MSSCSLDYWRNFFLRSERSIFEVIEMSIAVAAADRPDELVRRRDGIVKSLYSFPSVAAANGRPEEADQPAADATSYCCSSGRGSQESSSEEADELQDALDDAFALLDEALRLKKILDNKNEEVRAYVRTQPCMHARSCVVLKLISFYVALNVSWGS